jgi:RNA polymerase sigma-70 factor (ECF subfamily)
MDVPGGAPAVGEPLLEACRRGDREAFRLLFEATKDRVYSLAVHFIGDETAASDISQEVFLKLVSRLEQFRGEARFDTWLFRLVANACMDEHRRRRRLVPLLVEKSTLPRERGGPQEASLVRREDREAVRLAVSRLSPKLRLPILLRYLEDLSYGEIAAALGCTKGTVASRLNRGHRELARTLGSLREGAFDRDAGKRRKTATNED